MGKGEKYRRRLPSRISTDHGTGACEQALEREPNATVSPQYGGLKVFQNEFYREASRIGALSALGAIVAFELVAAVETFNDVVSFTIGDLGLGLRRSLHFVFHKARFEGTKVGKTR